MRLFNRLWAMLWGYFWLPCPLCGRMFGGHETARNGWTSRGTMVCKKCEQAVIEQNRKDFKDGKINYYFEATKQ